MEKIFLTNEDIPDLLEAVEDAQPKMELIETITVEVENIGNIVRDGFALDGIILIVNCPVVETVGKIQTRVHYPTASGGNYATLTNNTVTNASNALQTIIEYYKRFGLWRLEWISNVKHYSASITSQPQYMYALDDTTAPYINKITLITTNIPIGTTIKIYGVRRNEN